MFRFSACSPILCEYCLIELNYFMIYSTILTRLTFRSLILVKLKWNIEVLLVHNQFNKNQICSDSLWWKCSVQNSLFTVLNSLQSVQHTLSHSLWHSLWICSHSLWRSLWLGSHSLWYCAYSLWHSFSKDLHCSENSD